jgi:hypothetical protein
MATDFEAKDRPYLSRFFYYSSLLSQRLDNGTNLSPALMISSPSNGPLFASGAAPSSSSLESESLPLLQTGFRCISKGEKSTKKTLCAKNHRNLSSTSAAFADL